MKVELTAFTFCSDAYNQHGTIVYTIVCTKILENTIKLAQINGKYFV